MEGGGIQKCVECGIYQPCPFTDIDGESPLCLGCADDIKDWEDAERAAKHEEPETWEPRNLWRTNARPELPERDGGGGVDGGE
jgi:hypothetical protein